MGTRKERLFLASIWLSWIPRLISRILPILQGSNARDGGQVISWWVKWHFLIDIKREVVPGIHRDVLNSQTPLRNDFCSPMFQWLWCLKGRLWWGVEGPAPQAAMPQIKKERIWAKPKELPAGSRKKRPSGCLFSSIIIFLKISHFQQSKIICFQNSKKKRIKSLLLKHKIMNYHEFFTTYIDTTTCSIFCSCDASLF